MNPLFYSTRGLLRLILRFPIMARISGRELIPKTGGFILASNHISYYDPPLLGTASTREMYYLAKRELFVNPFIGRFLHFWNARSVARGSADIAGLREAVTVIKSGHGLVMFPEGTRSRDGELGRPKPGIGVIARMAQCPIVPCYTTGQDRFAACLFSRRKITIQFGEPITFEMLEKFPKGKTGAIEIAQTVMDRIKALKDSHLALK